ncbi:DNA topoisomerase 3-alpha [Bienertia sinuspersici]
MKLQSCHLIVTSQLYVTHTFGLQKNYLDVYRFESWGGSMIPTYLLGQQLADYGSCGGQDVFERCRHGTDATMHDHIKKLLDRFYATKDANTRFSPTNLFQMIL